MPSDVYSNDPYASSFRKYAITDRKSAFMSEEEEENLPPATHLASHATWFHRRAIWPDLTCARFDCAVTCRLSQPEYVWKISHAGSERILVLPESMDSPEVWLAHAQEQLVRWSYLVHAERRLHEEADESLARAQERNLVRVVPSATKVVHIRSVDPDDPQVVYIGRAMSHMRGGERRFLPASIWANPYRIKNGASREMVLRWYESGLRNKLIADPTLLAKLPALEGKILACWCKSADHDVPCHGDVLVRLIEELKLTGRVAPFLAGSRSSDGKSNQEG